MMAILILMLALAIITVYKLFFSDSSKLKVRNLESELYIAHEYIDEIKNYKEELYDEYKYDLERHYKGLLFYLVENSSIYFEDVIEEIIQEIKKENTKYEWEFNTDSQGQLIQVFYYDNECGKKKSRHVLISKILQYAVNNGFGEFLEHMVPQYIQYDVTTYNRTEVRPLWSKNTLKGTFKDSIVKVINNCGEIPRY